MKLPELVPTITCCHKCCKVKCNRVDKLLKIHRYWIRFWVFEVVTVSLKCKNCFERGGFGSLSCFGIKGFKYLSCFGIKCKRFKYFPPSTNNMDWGTNPDLQDLKLCRNMIFGEQEKGSNKTHKRRYWAKRSSSWLFTWSEVDDNTRRGLPFLC